MRTMSQSSTNYGSTNRRSVYYLIVPNCVDCGDVIFMYGSLAFSSEKASYGAIFPRPSIQGAKSTLTLLLLPWIEGILLHS